MAAEFAVPLETVLEQRGGLSRGAVLAGQRHQRLSQIAGRKHVEFAANPATGTTVISHRDYRGDLHQLVRRLIQLQTPQRPQRGEQAVTTAERDNALSPDSPPRRCVCLWRAHSRPKSPWVAVTT